MGTEITRRALMAASASLLALGAGSAANAQAKTKLRFSCAFTETDPRAEAYKGFAAAIKDEFDFEPYWGNTLFKQGTELVALSATISICAISPRPTSPSRFRRGRC